MVGTDEVMEFSIRMAIAKATDGVDRVGDPPTRNFQRIDLGISATRQRDPEHRETEAGWCEWVIWFEGRLCGRNEDDAIQLQFLKRGLSHEEVASVNGVK
jgi:hypothetical protein